MKLSRHFAFTTLVALASVASAQDTRQTGLRAFRDIASVLLSPRCLNCHVPGNQPLQGDDNHAHNMLVQRGPDGKGAVTMRCANCHQDTNVSARHAPPGVPGWRMPNAETPMAWAGLSTAQLCRVLKEPATNGRRSPADLIEHVTSDKIVNWGWSPGIGRTVPPLSHSQFVEDVKSWVAAGSPCSE